MGLDLVTRLVYGVDVKRRGPDGRSFQERVVSGEFGAYDGDSDKPFGSLEEHFVNNEPFYEVNGGFDVLAAEDLYRGEEVGAVAGVVLLQVESRGTSRNLTPGMSVNEFRAKLQDAKQRLSRHGIMNPELWLISYAG